MFNSSHLNPTVKKKVFKAMLKALRHGSVEHVRTRAGRAYLAVRERNGLYELTDKSGANVAACFKRYPMIYTHLVVTD
jgi:hypothetical protein